MSNQMEKRDVCKIVRLFVFQKEESISSPSFPHKYLHINDSLLPVKEEVWLGRERQMTNEDEVTWA